MQKDDKDLVAYRDEVAKMYESGGYFTESKKWYFEKYLSHYKTSSMFIITAFFCIALTLYAFYIFSYELRQKHSYSGVITIDESVTQGKLLVLDKIPNLYSSNNQNIANFFLLSFVSDYESYTNTSGLLNEINGREFIVAPHSSDTVLNAFRDRVDKIYVEEFLAGYSRVAKAEVVYYMEDEIEKFSIQNWFKPSVVPTRAYVDFTLSSYYKGVFVSAAIHRAFLQFYFKPIERIDGKFSDISFVVTDYRFVF